MKTFIVNINYFHRFFGFSDISFLQYTLKYIVQQLYKVILSYISSFLNMKRGRMERGGVGILQSVCLSLCLHIYQYVLSTTADRIN